MIRDVSAVKCLLPFGAHHRATLPFVCVGVPTVRIRRPGLDRVGDDRGRSSRQYMDVPICGL